MFRGESGILKCLNTNSYKVDWRQNIIRFKDFRGIEYSTIYGFSADTPDSIRGSNLSGIWFDELGAYNNPRMVYEQGKLALRKGKSRSIITTTPSPKSVPLLKEISGYRKTIVTGGNSEENLANLSPAFAEMIESKKGTKLADLEIRAQLIDNIGSFWNRDQIQYQEIPINELKTIIIGVDPAVSYTDNSSESGIIVAGSTMRDGKKIGIVLDDLSDKAKIEDLIPKIIKAYYNYQADYVAVEINNGGDWIGNSIHHYDPTVRVKKVTATRGKSVRAQPILSLYEMGRIFHRKHFEKLEKQMVEFDPDETNKSGLKDRVDALVWSLTANFDIKQSFNPHMLQTPIHL